MAVGDFQPSSFEFYEGIRILVPGAVVVATYGAVVETFGVDAPSPSANAFGALIAALLVGLVLYFIDLPAKSRVYKAALPHSIFEDWTLEERGHVSPQNFYFILLDERLPSGIRSRALYMGSIFRIGFEAILVLASSATIVLLLLTAGVGTDRVGGETPGTLLWISAGVHAAIPTVMAVHGLITKSSTFTRSAQQLLWLPLAAAALAPAGVLSVDLAEAPKWVAMAGIGASGFAWILLYVFGARTGAGRRNLGAFPAAFALGVVGAATAAFAACYAEGAPAGSAAAFGGWSLASLAALVMVSVRGHERRWFGAYYTQRAWFTLREADLKRRYKKG